MNFQEIVLNEVSVEIHLPAHFDTKQVNSSETRTL